MHLPGTHYVVRVYFEIWSILAGLMVANKTADVLGEDPAKEQAESTLSKIIFIHERVYQIIDRRCLMRLGNFLSFEILSKLHRGC